MKKQNDDEQLNLTPSETITLTRRESMMNLDLIENPPPTEKFLEAQARWQKMNREAIESSNEYVEKHGLPLEKVRQF